MWITAMGYTMVFSLQPLAKIIVLVWRKVVVLIQDFIIEGRKYCNDTECKCDFEK